MDVKTAFLNAPVDEEIYMEQPQGFEERAPDGELLVCKMLKSLYGLKQSPRNWNKEIDKWQRRYGAVPTSGDPCVFVRGSLTHEEGLLIIVLWVDDLILAASKRKTLNEYKAAISQAYQMKDLGELRWILGMEIRRDRSKRTLEVLQTPYIDSVLEKFSMSDCKPIDTPAAGKLERIEGGQVDSEYMAVVGCAVRGAGD